MEIEVKQRNRRRKRAQRMQQELKDTRANKANADESEAEDVIPKKPPRPPNRRKKQKDLLKELLCEEDIVEGFSILQFRSYEDLELVVKIAAKDGIKRLVEVERPKLEPKAHITNHILVHNNHNGLTLTHDPATSDDSGRASERLTGSSVVSVAPRERDADSSRDRLSDASSRCSSGKGYICDSEGEDDKGSDTSSVIFPSAPSVRKHEFPGALPPSLPQGLPHGPGSSPLPAPTAPKLPAPSPAPAQQPPHHPPQAIPSAAVAPAMGESASLGGAAQPMGGAVQPQEATIKPEIPVMGAKMPPVTVQGECALEYCAIFTEKHPFPDQTDMLRRELDNRFLASQDRGLGVAPPPYLRTEMHQHQHHHTHVHQHTTSLLPPPGASALFSSQMPLSPIDRLARRTQSSFKDIPKLGGVDSPFYRQGLGVPGYPGYNPGLMGHPGLATGPTPFAPPNHLPTFQPKSLTAQDPTKPKIMKSGKWNAMHVRVAWEIYHHQQKSGDAKGTLSGIAPKSGVPSTADLLRAPSHLFSPGMHQRPPELSPYTSPALSNHRPVGFEQPTHHPASLFATPAGHLGFNAPSPFGMSPFGASREAAHLAALHHDPWRSMQRSIPGFPPAVNPLPPTLPGRYFGMYTRFSMLRERRDREEKQRRLEQQQQQERERREKERRELERRENERRERERELLMHQQRLAAESAAKQAMPAPGIRERSPMRNGQQELADIRVKEEPRVVVKEEDMMTRADPNAYRYHPYMRHPGALQPPPPPSALDRSRMLAHS
ncbi:autism susceptibility gene 2 protein, partial [Dendroctonus ponderosae]|uniref:autism susceptibility gene 2 protein n=1 Tax=Dendroctonus ponderosae TaxID=77166 RepID=UPI002035177E